MRQIRLTIHADQCLLQQTKIEKTGINAKRLRSASNRLWRSIAGSIYGEKIGTEYQQRDDGHAGVGGKPLEKCHIVFIGDGAVIRQQEVCTFTVQQSN